MRRALVRLSALAFQCAQEHGLLTDHEGAADLAHLDVEHRAMSTPADVAALLGLVDGRTQSLGGGRRTAGQRDDGRLGPHCPGRDGHALDHGMWVALHEHPVELGAGVGLEAVGHDVAPPARLRRHSRATWSRSGSRRHRGRAGPIR